MLNFAERKQLVERYTRPGPNLYRSLYDLPENTPPLSLQSEDEWKSLPFLTKDILIGTPIEERLFTERSNLDQWRVSSGTTGKPPIFSPRTYRAANMDYRLSFYDFKKPILAFTIPLLPHWFERLQILQGHAPQVIVFDPKRARTSVRLARIAGVDAISVFSFHMPIIGELMLKEGMTNDIRYIEITGEPCSEALLTYLQQTFPNAVVYSEYGATELEDFPIGFMCRPITGEEPLCLYHFKKTHFIELIDSETGTPLALETGIEGELVLTAWVGEGAATPFIRYRTGDMVRIVEKSCAAHNQMSFTVLGRATLDFLKIAGGLIRTDEVQRVMRLFGNHVTERFELHLYEDSRPDSHKIRVELRVEPKTQDTDLDTLSREIAKLLRVAPSFTYADGVAQNMYLPLVCTRLETPPTAGKTIYLFKH